MNPLLKAHEQMTWAEMARKTGLHLNTINQIAKYTPQQIMKMQVGTVIKLADIGINMLEGIKY